MNRRVNLVDAFDDDRAVDQCVRDAGHDDGQQKGENDDREHDELFRLGNKSEETVFGPAVGKSNEAED